jgi:signal transduction histidine kinase
MMSCKMSRASTRPTAEESGRTEATDPSRGRHPVRNLILLLLFFGVGAGLAYLDDQLDLHTMLVETVHGLVVTAIFVFCLVCQRRYPEIRQFGWSAIVWGVALLMVGSWVDLLDDPPAIAWLQINGVPFGRSPEQAFIKKILGYTGGISLMAYGFFQWIPWMINTRMEVEKLNLKLGVANRNLNRIQMSLQDHIESERLHISRELHDVVAQQLTHLNFQVQLCRKQLQQDAGQAGEMLVGIGGEISDTLKNVRQISRDLRPESLYALGLIPALEQLIEKFQAQYPALEIQLDYRPLAQPYGEAGPGTRIEASLDEHRLLHLYRILQESLGNAVKHSQAKAITLTLEEEADRFRAVVEDDGAGLPWPEVPTDDVLMRQGHLGLIGMKERVRELSGTFSLTQREPRGARMELIFS